MNADPLRHLPELHGQILAAEASRLRATDEVMARWDAEARASGLGPDWRCGDDALEASRQTALGDVLAREDLWIFAYGSLMWDPAVHFCEARRARLRGHQRRFSLRTPIGRGTAQQPGLVLALEPQEPGHCNGLAFRIDRCIAERESRLLWRREMLMGGYTAQLLPVDTPQGPVRALALLADPAHPHHAANLPLAAVADTIATARGQQGSNRDYLQRLAAQLTRLGIADAHIAQLDALVSRAPTTPTARSGA